MAGSKTAPDSLRAPKDHINRRILHHMISEGFPMGPCYGPVGFLRGLFSGPLVCTGYIIGIYWGLD